jgi:uncharacterized protein YecE (DUF72 family)
MAAEPASLAPDPRSSDLWLGTSSWSHDSWVGGFYPPGTAPGDYIRHYATVLPSVEIDSTFYRIPSSALVSGWAQKTPPGFIFAAKAPGVITHEKRLAGCEAELEQFLEVMSGLGERLGPILFQFPYYRRGETSLQEFTARLGPFLKLLPRRGVRFAVEVRNKSWVGPELTDLLAAHQVALAWIDHPWFWDPRALAERPGALTTDFLYLRWLGDRKGIEKITTEWRREVVDREARLQAWAGVLRSVRSRARPIYGYFNNHYSGYAIGALERFARLWRADAG